MTTKRTALALLLALAAATLSTAGGCSEESLHLSVERDGPPATIRIEAGEHFTHKMKIMPLIHVNNAPQMAVWAETAQGEFIETIFVTSRVATQSWRSAPGDDTPKEHIRRDEALPVWSYRSAAVEQAEGVDHESRAGEPAVVGSATDAVTAATPKQSFEIATTLPDRSGDIILYLEVNNSTDFNEAYPADAQPGTASYSGGEWGSGQPSLVYSAPLPAGAVAGGRRTFELVGHGSPDGSSGAVTPDLTGVTTARSILSEAEVSWGQRDGS
jgi:hypothetical protein